MHASAMFERGVRGWVARRLEQGGDSRVAAGVARLWGSVARRAIARPVVVPRGLRTIGVGSAVLGGGGKTPLAIAIASELAARGHRVALVGHAYHARPGRPRVVGPSDSVEEVGDDALAAARALEGANAFVVVAPDRSSALAEAVVRGARVAVIDGALQARPRAFDESILAVDAARPWGGGACPPAGDLRAPVRDLLAVAGRVAAIGGRGVGLDPTLETKAIRVESALDAGDLARARGARCGLLLAIGHPERVELALRAGGVEPAIVERFADHAAFSPAVLARLARAPVDLWLTTARCATKLPPAVGGAEVVALRHRLDAKSLVGSLSVL